MSTSPDNIDELAGSAGKMGRRLGMVVYWILVIYVVAVAFISLIPQIFLTQNGSPNTIPSSSPTSSEAQ